MNGQDLWEWLNAIPEEERRNSKVLLQATRRVQPLTTAHVYDENRDGKLDAIYLIYK